MSREQGPGSGGPPRSPVLEANTRGFLPSQAGGNLLDAAGSNDVMEPRGAEGRAASQRGHCTPLRAQQSLVSLTTSRGTNLSRTFTQCLSPRPRLCPSAHAGQACGAAVAAGSRASAGSLPPVLRLGRPFRSLCVHGRHRGLDGTLCPSQSQDVDAPSALLPSFPCARPCAPPVGLSS